MTRIAPLMEHLGWAVVHSLWQGAAILIAVLLIRRVAGPGRPHVAYLAGVVGLIAVFGAFLATLAWHIGTAVEPTVAALPNLTAPTGEALSPASGMIAPGGSPSTFDWQAALPWLGLVWSAGFFVLSLQCMYAWAKTRCYATIGLSEPEDGWAQRFAQLVESSGVAQSVRLQVSALVESPVTLGTLRPIVLVPAGFLTGLPTAQVEAILLHEIAHIRRHDFLVGLLQTAIRTTLYFNPAVRLMSRLVDEDREQACDDFAVRTSGNPADLAKGLASLRLSLAPALVMAANDGRSGPLLTRLERIMGRQTGARGLDKVSAVAIAAVLMGTTVFATSSWAHPHRTDTDGDFQVPDTVVTAEAPPMPAMPPMPVMPEIPGVPAVPAIPAVPPVPAFGTDGDFDAAMEAWGESMESWGEALGESLEGQWAPQMEAWGEEMEAWGEAYAERMESEWKPKIEAWAEGFEARMEAWGESVEGQGHYIEYYSEMSDTELSELGLSRVDVELMGEDFGLTVAEGVVGAMLGGTAASHEALSEIAEERAELDQRRLETVKRIVEADIQSRKARDKAYAKRDKAYAEREKAYAERDRMRALRDEARAEREAERAEREAERARMRAERNAERAHRLAEDAFDAGEVSRGLLTKLRADGLIDSDAERYVFKSSPDWTKVDGRKVSASHHKAYRDYLCESNASKTADVGIEMRRDRIELEMRDGNSTTRVTMTD